MSSGSWYKDLGRNAIDRLNVVTTQNSDRPCKCIKVEDMGFLLSKDRQSGVGNSLRLRSIKTQFFYGKLGLEGETPAKPFDMYVVFTQKKPPRPKEESQ